jgi:hypothetical protein
MHSIKILIQNRGLIKLTLEGLSPGDYVQIPTGFDNNIAWNLGHIIVTQQALHYTLSGLATAVTKTEVAMYKTGTSPANWSTEPDIPHLLTLFDDLPQKLLADYESGQFQRYRAYRTSTGIHLESLADALAFNNFHEGLHLGAILALKKFVS